MRITSRRHEVGDTIIEVLFAVTVFAIVAVGCLTIMNQGTATAQRSLEITLVRNQMDAQAETIRYLHRSYVSDFKKGSGLTNDNAKEWQNMVKPIGSGGHGASAASAYGDLSATNTCPTTVPGDSPFVINTKIARVYTGIISMTPPNSVPPYPQIVYKPGGAVETYGLWVEAVPATDTNNATSFVDFHIRACWEGPGTTTPLTLGTIVRLYEPR